ncbi:MAG: methyltransferase domain-containing protein [Sedimentisphaerales bacterium]|nr:methyltransferase domain-containing protein [Sedimentisphaerales bacterium]
MSQENIKPTDIFDPGLWSSVYDNNNKNDSAFIFRRGAEIVFDISSNIARAGQLWLDIGCGSGDLAEKLSQKDLSVIGVDHDPAMLELANKRFLANPSTGNLKFVKASVCNLPFNNETVDGITAVSLAGCLSSPDEFFRQAHRILRKGGFAVMTFTNRDSFLLKINLYMRKIAHKTQKSALDSLLIRLYRPARVIEDLQNVGFKMVDVKFYNFFLNPANRLIPSKSFALYLEYLNKYKIARRLGRNFIIVAQKI